MAYATLSREQLVDRALFVLGVTPIGQTPDDDDRQLVDNLLEPVLARLNAEGVTHNVNELGEITELADPDAIPAAQFLDVAILVADAVKGDFGLGALPQEDPEAARMRLRTVLSTGPTMEEYTLVDDETGVNTTHYRIETLEPEWF